MHGFIFSELQKYVTQKLGESAWEKLLSDSNLNGKKYFIVKVYPDKELEDILATAVKITGLSRDAILEDFGNYLVPHLFNFYGSLLNPEWKTLDVLEQTEKTMHTAVRYGDKTATPPALVCERLNDKTVNIKYTSDRHMSALGVGIIKGIASHFNEKVEIENKKGVKDGKEIADIRVELL
ncbi:MAG TPA: heme NO-binding domain-containing protein [Bacteroidia bacterium]|nr:heme NO-binding domain-containing protein [Bacteroidia bacterium]